jgi:hypothetical protein
MRCSDLPNHGLLIETTLDLRVSHNTNLAPAFGSLPEQASKQLRLMLSNPPSVSILTGTTTSRSLDQSTPLHTAQKPLHLAALHRDRWSKTLRGLGSVFWIQWNRGGCGPQT